MTTLTEYTSADAPSERAITAGDRFVATALVLLAAVYLGFQVLAGEFVPPLLAFGLIFLALGVAVARRRPRWLLITVIVLVLLQLVGSAPFILSNIVHPASTLSFLVEAFSVIAGLTAVAGAIAALRGTGVPGRRRPIAVIAAGLALAAVIVSVVAAAAMEADAFREGDVPVEVAKVQFPEQVAVPAGGATLWVDNQDPVRHTLVVEDAGIHVELPATTSVRIDADLGVGMHRFFCDVPGHESMEGWLEVG
jgi:plastocyanin